MQHLFVKPKEIGVHPALLRGFSPANVVGKTALIGLSISTRKLIQKMKKLLFGAMLLFSMCSMAKAQCPTNIAPLGVTWNVGTPITYTIPGTNCQLTISYCYRMCVDFPTVGEDRYQTFIHDIVSVGTDCIGMSFLTIADAAADAVNLTAPPSSIPCLPPYPKMTGIMPVCWRNNGGGHFSSAGCNGQSRCLKTIEYCSDGYSFFNMGNITYQILGTPNCTDFGTQPIPVGECGVLPCGPRQ